MKKNIMSMAVAGIMSLAIATTAFASPATVKSNVNFRAAPSTSAQIYKNLKPGTSLEVLEQVNAYWLKVNVNGQIGYLSPKYITYDTTQPAGRPATVSSSVNFRAAPSTSAQIYRNLKPGTQLTVLEQVNAYWLKVNVNGQIGYLSPKYITYNATQPPQQPQPVGNQAVVASHVNFRSAPSTSSTVYQTLKPGTPVTVLEQVNAYWLKVNVNGKVGYLSPKYISYNQSQPAPTPPPAPAPSSVAQRVIQHAMNLRGVTRYEYGVNKPPTVMDCSAMVQYVFGLEGIKLKWGTRFLKDSGTYVPRNQLQPGDLVLLRVGSSSSIGHVGIYIGNGQMIHNSPSANGITIDSITSGYWKDRYVTARRVI